MGLVMGKSMGKGKAVTGLSQVENHVEFRHVEIRKGGKIHTQQRQQSAISKSTVRMATPDVHSPDVHSPDVHSRR